MSARRHGWLGCVVAAVAVGSPCAQEPAAQGPRAAFDTVLWCGDHARAMPRARALGFTSVQLGRGADPAPVRAAGFDYYLDQPIGKGLLELRDEDWQPVRDAYEKSRDPAVLVRPGCARTPGALAQAAAAAAAEAARVYGPGLRFVALADEASATRHDAPLDTCRCEHCLRAFRGYVQRRFGTIDAANGALGTQFASFDALVPPTTDQLRRRELGDAALPLDLRPFAVWLDFVDDGHAEAVLAIAAAVRGVTANTPVGLTGLAAPAAFGGNDPARTWPQLSLLEPYAIGGAPELARCLAPAAVRYETLSPPAAANLGPLPLGSWVTARCAAMAAAGLSGVVVWNDGTVLTPAGEPTAFGAAVRDSLRRMRPVLDACAGARIAPGPVWIVESQASVRAWWMLDSAGDGMTWVRRLASYEAEHSTSQAARIGWSRLLQDLGLQPQFVAETALPERLLRERPRCLVLGGAVALADRTVQAIAAYVRSGGTVLADHSTALYDDTLRRREAGGLDDLFGITARSLRWDDLWVREGQPRSRERGLPLAEAGLRGVTAEQRRDGDAHLENTWGRGRAVYLNAPVAAYGGWRLDEKAVDAARELRRRVRAVLREAGADPVCEVRGDGLPTCIERTRLLLRDGRELLAIRVHALDAPALLQRLAADGPRPVRLELPAARTLRQLDGTPIGSGTGFDVRLDALAGTWFEVAK